MIDLIFNYGSEIVIVKINGKTILFGNTSDGAKMATIDGLKLDFNGTIREFPDLAKEINWREKAIERFKEHIRNINSEDDIASYIIHELKTKGYSPKLKQKAGFRPERI